VSSRVVFHDRFKKETTALLVDNAGGVILIGVPRAELPAHFVLARGVLVRRWVLDARRVLERRLGDIPVQQRVPLLHRSKTGIDWPLDYVLRLLRVGIVVLRPRIARCIEIGIRLPTVRARIENGFSF